MAHARFVGFVNLGLAIADIPAILLMPFLLSWRGKLFWDEITKDVSLAVSNFITPHPHLCSNLCDGHTINQ